MGKVAIYIDYDNLYITLDKYYQKANTTPLKIDIVSKIKNLFKDDKVLMIKAFADFEKINTLLSDLQKEQVELRHVYSSKSKKNASDIALAISVIKSVYSNQNIDKYVIISSDSDMLPIINEMMYFDKEIYVVYSDFCSKDGYEDYLNEQSYKTIEEVLGLSVYRPMSDSIIKDRSEDFLQVINQKINETFHRYKSGGTCTKKDIKEALYNSSLDLCDNDCSLIIEYLLNKNMICETTNPPYKYPKVLLNPQYVSEQAIEFDELITEENFQKINSLTPLTTR